MDPRFEAVELEGNSVIKIFPVRCALLQENHSWHYHPECELTHVVKGHGTRFVGDSVQRFAPGDLVLVGANLPHCWTNDDNENSDPSRNDLLVLQFKQDCLGSDFLNSPGAQTLKTLFDEGQRGLAYSGDCVKKIGGSLERLQEESGLSQLANFINLLDLLCKSNEVERLTSKFYIADTKDFQGGRMSKVVDYVRQNLAYDIKQSDVADLVSMTPQGFSRFFRATTGRTFVSFVNVMRIMKACQLLVNTDEHIIEVAFECGYANLSNFNRRFSELKKMTPREYRAQYRKLA